MRRSQHVLVRQWQLVRELSVKRNGLTVRQLVEKFGVSKQTLYRDLTTLSEAGVPLVSCTSSGEARYRLLGDGELPRLGLNALQVSALHLARAALEPMAGAAFVAELDGFLAQLRPVEAPRAFHFAVKGTGHPQVMKVVERAIHARRRARLHYRAASRGGTTSIVHVEPLVMRVSDGKPYFRAYCVERAAERTYKIARVAHIELTDEPATHNPTAPPLEAFTGSVKAWTGSLTSVKIRLDREVAWLASEYPLVEDQQAATQEDGNLVIEARVAGIAEAARWVLSWGGGAEALEPPQLRNSMRTELARALGKYDGPGPAKAKKRKSTERATGRLMEGGTRRA